MDEEIVTPDIAGRLEARPSISDSNQKEPSLLLIQGGTCVNDDEVFEADILISDNRIKEIGPGLSVPDGAKIISAKGLLVLPGGIDMNTHFQLPFMGTVSADDFYSGTKASLAGGTTMIVDCVWDDPGTPLLYSYDKWREWADSKVACDYALAVGVTSWADGKVGDDMSKLVSEKGINTFRVSQEYKDSYMLNDGELLHVFKKCKELGAYVTTLAENGHIIEKKAAELISLGITGPEGHAMCRAEEIEAEATQRAIVLANQARCPIGVTPVTSKSSAKAISEARRKGYVVFGAPVTASLGTDGTHYWNKCWRHAASFVMAPPLRPDPTTSTQLMEYLACGDMQYVGSAHCTFNADQKGLGSKDFRNIPHGVNGTEDRMSIIWEKGVHSGKMDACRFVSVTSSTPAKILNIYPQKGRLAAGSDADLVIWDPEATREISAKTHTSAADFNIFEGTQPHGVPVYVISNGEVVVDEDGLHVTPGRGRFIPTPPNSLFVYGRVNARDQALAPQKVEREDYDGAVTSVADVCDGGKGDTSSSAIVEEVVVSQQATDQFHQRPPTRSGGRHMQESSFSFSGDQFDDTRSSKASSRVLNPPGGRSSGLW